MKKIFRASQDEYKGPHSVAISEMPVLLLYLLCFLVILTCVPSLCEDRVVFM